MDPIMTSIIIRSIYVSTYEVLSKVRKFGQFTDFGLLSVSFSLSANQRQSIKSEISQMYRKSLTSCCIVKYTHVS